MAQNTAELEEGCSITAGRIETDSFFKEVAAQTNKPAKKEVYRGFLCRVINLARRSAGISIEQLAELAHVDALEIFRIEEEVGGVPDPAVVSRLARALNLPPGKLQQLAGYVTI